jgi:ribonuclease Z
MQITFLGTSSGTPTRDRNVSGIALGSTQHKAWCLVDCGEGTQHQLLKTPLSLLNLQAICITHVHGDHCYGLPGLLASAALAGRTAPLYLLAPRAIQTFIETIQATTQLRLSYELNFTAIDEANVVLPDLAFALEITELSHRVPSFAFCFTEKNVEHKLDTAKLMQAGIAPGAIWGQLQQGQTVTLADGRILHAADYVQTPRPARRIIIAGDNDTPHLLTELAHSAQVLIHEATYTEDIAAKVGSHPQHCTAQRVAEFAETLHVPHLVLTHFSARYRGDKDEAPSLWDLQREAQAVYTGNVQIARDFSVFTLHKNGQLTRSELPV